MTHARARPRGKATAALARIGTLLLVLLALWGLWEGYRWLWIETGWTKPFVVNDTTLPHLHDIVGALFESPQEGGPLLIDLLFHYALFTAKEAVVGFAIGATIGFLLGAVIARFQMLQRGLMPYVVASQPIPILAIAPIKKPATKASHRADLGRKAIANLRKQGLDVKWQELRKSVVKLKLGGE